MGPKVSRVIVINTVKWPPLRTLPVSTHTLKKKRRKKKPERKKLKKMLRSVSAARMAMVLRRLEGSHPIQRPLILLHQISTVHVPIATPPTSSTAPNESSSFSFRTNARSRMARRIPPVRPDNYSDSDSELDKGENEEEGKDVADGADGADGAEEGGDDPGELEGVMLEIGEFSDSDPSEEEEEKENK